MDGWIDLEMETENMIRVRREKRNFKKTTTKEKRR